MGEAKRRKEKDCTFGKVPNQHWQKSNLRFNLKDIEPDLFCLLEPKRPNSLQNVSLKPYCEKFQNLSDTIFEENQHFLEPPENKEALNNLALSFREKFDIGNQEDTALSKEELFYLVRINLRLGLSKGLQCLDLICEKKGNEYYDFLTKNSQQFVLDYFFYLVFKDLFSDRSQEHLDNIFSLSSEMLLFPEEAIKRVESLK